MSIRSKVFAQGLDATIRFERNYGVATVSGGTTDDWRPLMTQCWAKVDGAPGGEPVLDGGIRTPMGYLVKVRSELVVRLSITALDRIVLMSGPTRGKILNIADIPDQGLKGGLTTITCSAGVNRG